MLLLCHYVNGNEFRSQVKNWQHLIGKCFHVSRIQSDANETITWTTVSAFNAWWIYHWGDNLTSCQLSQTYQIQMAIFLDIFSSWAKLKRNLNPTYTSVGIEIWRIKAIFSFSLESKWKNQNEMKLFLINQTVEIEATHLIPFGFQTCLYTWDNLDNY